MQDDANKLYVVGNNWGALVAATTLARAGRAVQWFTGDGRPCPKALLVPGGAVRTRRVLEGLQGAGLQGAGLHGAGLQGAGLLGPNQLFWQSGVGVASAAGGSDVIDGDDLPAPLHVLCSLIGLSALTWPQRIQAARGLLACLQTQPQDLETGVSLAQWLHAQNQHRPATVALWASLSALFCDRMPPDVPAEHGIQAIRQGLLSTAASTQIGLLPEGLAPAFNAARTLVEQSGGSVIDDDPAPSGRGVTLISADGPSGSAPVCVRITALADAPDADTRPLAIAAPLDSDPVVWLGRQPARTMAGIEGLVTPIWAWVNPHHPDPAPAAVAAAQAAWGTNAPLTIKSAEVIDAGGTPAAQPPALPPDAPDAPDAPEAPDAPGVIFFNGGWADGCGLVGEAATERALKALGSLNAGARVIKSQPAKAEAFSTPPPQTGWLYEFMLG